MTDNQYTKTIRQQCTLTLVPNIPDDSFSHLANILAVLYESAVGVNAANKDKYKLVRAAVNQSTKGQEIVFLHPMPMVVMNTVVMFLISEKAKLAKENPPRELASTTVLEISSSSITDMKTAELLFSVARAEHIMKEIEAKLEEHKLNAAKSAIASDSVRDQADAGVIQSSVCVGEEPSKGGSSSEVAIKA